VIQKPSISNNPGCVVVLAEAACSSLSQIAQRAQAMLDESRGRFVCFELFSTLDIMSYCTTTVAVSSVSCNLSTRAATSNR
jgi:hypothetical protein